VDLAITWDRYVHNLLIPLFGQFILYPIFFLGNAYIYISFSTEVVGASGDGWQRTWSSWLRSQIISLAAKYQLSNKLYVYCWICHSIEISHNNIGSLINKRNNILHDCSTTHYPVVLFCDVPVSLFALPHILVRSAIFTLSMWVYLRCCISHWLCRRKQFWISSIFPKQ
jgi:hypothetical protein